jgi:hypothetical protein
LGLLLHAIVHPADIQDRDGGILVMANLFGMFPFLKKLFADGGYQGPEFNQALPRFVAPRKKTSRILRRRLPKWSPTRKASRAVRR